MMTTPVDEVTSAWAQEQLLEAQTAMAKALYCQVEADAIAEERGGKRAVKALRREARQHRDHADSIVAIIAAATSVATLVKLERQEARLNAITELFDGEAAEQAIPDEIDEVDTDFTDRRPLIGGTPIFPFSGRG